jgi:hypothetical protein
MVTLFAVTGNISGITTMTPMTTDLTDNTEESGNSLEKAVLPTHL